MKLTTAVLLLASIVAVSTAAASDDSNKLIRGGGGVVATADDVEADKTSTHTVLRGVNFYEAAVQGDFEDIPNTNTIVCGDGSECSVNKFCGTLGVTNTYVEICHSVSCPDGYTCEMCSTIDGAVNGAVNGTDVGVGTYQCKLTSAPSQD